MQSSFESGFGSDSYVLPIPKRMGGSTNCYYHDPSVPGTRQCRAPRRTAALPSVVAFVAPGKPPGLLPALRRVSCCLGWCVGVELQVRELRAGCDLELAEDVSEVEVDCAWAQEHLSCDVFV